MTLKTKEEFAINFDDENPYQSPIDFDNQPPAYQVEELALRLSRLVAAMVDGLISGSITVAIWFALGCFEPETLEEFGLFTAIVFAVTPIMVHLAVHGYLLTTRGQTLGKMLLGIRIVDYKTNTLLPIGKLVALRVFPVHLAAALSSVGSFFGLVDVLLIFGEERRCAHDLLAGTKVVRASVVPVTLREDLHEDF